MSRTYPDDGIVGQISEVTQLPGNRQELLLDLTGAL